jgi:ketosteroid isomerase-like protein
MVVCTMRYIFIICLGALTLLPGCKSNNHRMNNLEIVKSTYEGKTSEENGKNLERYLAADATWTEAKGFPYSGTYTGFEEISKNVFHRLATEWIGYKFTPEGYIADGDQVAAYGTYTGINKNTNKSFEARVVHLWKLTAGKIVSFEQFVDSQPVNDAMK